MQDDTLIPEHEFARWWGVTTDTLRRARALDLLTPDLGSNKGNSAYYTPRSIDVFHQRNARHCRTPLPTATELAAGTRKLLSLKEAVAQSGIGYDHLLHATRDGEIGRIRFGEANTQRIPDTELADYIARRTNQEAVPLGDVIRILCTSHQLVEGLMKAGTLRQEFVPRTSPSVFVNRQSIIVYLQGRLHPTADAEWWYEQQVAHLDEDWLSQFGIHKEFGLGRLTIQEAVQNGELYAIRVGKRRWSAPRWAIRQYLHQQRVLSAQEICLIFGVDIELAQYWIKKRSLCRLHHHDRFCPKQSCIQGYITSRRVTNTVDAGLWLQRTLEGHEPVILGRTIVAAGELPLTFNELLACIERDNLLAVRLPPTAKGEPDVALMCVGVRRLGGPEGVVFENLADAA